MTTLSERDRNVLRFAEAKLPSLATTIHAVPFFQSMTLEDRLVDVVGTGLDGSVEIPFFRRILA